MILLTITVFILSIFMIILVFLLLQKNKVKSEVDGKTYIELLVMAETQMNNNDRLIHICKLVRTIDLQLIEPWQAQGYADIIKKELSKLYHVFNIK